MKQGGDDFYRLEMIFLTITHLWMAPPYLIRELAVNCGISC